MEKYIDLHTHSIYSEGILTCKELLDLAIQHHISVLSLTDHNGIDGLPEIINLSKQYKIEVMPGVEIYTRYQNKGLHLLGYNFTVDNVELSRELHNLQKAHIDKIKQTLTNLEKQGFKIEAEKLFNNPSRYLGAVHILRALEKHPENQKKMDNELPPEHNNYFGKIFYYLGYGRPAYLPQSELPTEKAIDIIKKSGGFTVLAHPGQQLVFEEDKILYELITHGLDGLEVLSPYHNWHQIEHYQKLALENKLLITGGSDYHADIDFTKQELIKRQWDYFKVPFQTLTNLKK